MIWGKTGAYLNGKVWSTNGDVFLSKAAKAGLRVRCRGHDGESEEAVLWWALLKMEEGQLFRDFLTWNLGQAESMQIMSVCALETGSITHNAKE